MRIAQVAPLFESVPPKMYGGTERIVSFLTEELVRLGHDVTLFASGDSQTSAKLASVCPEALRLSKCAHDPTLAHFLMLEEVYRQAGQFDLIHFHVDFLHYPISRREKARHVTTLHGRLDLPGLDKLYAEYSDMPLVAISKSQRNQVPTAHWQGVVLHGLPKDLYHAGNGSGGYLAFLGRVSPEKGLDRAIEIAKRADMGLRIAAKVDTNDQHYFQTAIKPLLDDPRIKFVGEIRQQEKNEFLGNAAALVFPIQWPEPFGLVQIEAMACGTPTIAFRKGAAPEVIDDGISGVLCDTIDQAVQAVKHLPALDRQRCRQQFENRFTAERMTGDYLEIYQAMSLTPSSHGRNHSSRGSPLHPGDVTPGRPELARVEGRGNLRRV